MSWFNKIKSICGFKNETATSEITNKEKTLDYSTMKVSELKQIAKAKGIKGYYNLRKAELISALDNN